MTLDPELPELPENAARILLWPPRPKLNVTGVRHYYLELEREEWKIDTIADILETMPQPWIVVLCRSRRQADLIVHQLRQRDFPASAIHGDLSLQDRDRALQEFRNAGRGTLVCMDMALSHGMRGGIAWHWGPSVIINYDVPADTAIYQNRVGRRGSQRVRSQGLAINFISDAQDRQRIRSMERYFGITVEDLPMDFVDLL